MKNTMEYKGFIGTIELDINNKVLRGKAKSGKSSLTYEANNIKELETAFRDVVDDYLENCENAGEEPKRSFTGRLGIRISPDVHKIAVQCAREQGITLNKFVSTAIKRAIREHTKSTKA